MACQKCFKLCVEGEGTTVAAENGHGYFCSDKCAKRGQREQEGRAARARNAAQAAADAAMAAKQELGTMAAASQKPLDERSSSSSRGKHSEEVANGEGSSHRGAAVATAAGARRDRERNECPECNGKVDILRAVGVVVAGQGSRLCCSKACAQAVMARSVELANEDTSS